MQHSFVFNNTALDYLLHGFFAEHFLLDLAGYVYIVIATKCVLSDQGFDPVTNGFYHAFPRKEGFN